MPDDTRYLRQRKGRYLVQVAVPDELREHFGRANVEKYLRTSSLTEAKRRRHAAVAEIFESFDRAREHSPLRPEEIGEARAAELRRVYEQARDQLDEMGEGSVEVWFDSLLDAQGPLLRLGQLLPKLGDDLGGTVRANRLEPPLPVS